MTTPPTSQIARERPILFSGEMVRAILDGRKTQTRRVVVPQPDASLNRYARDVDRFRCVGTDVASGRRVFEAGNFAGPINAFRDGRDSVKADVACAYGAPGDQLWVRETWGVGCRPDPASGWRDGIEFRADEVGLGERESLPLRKVPDDVDLSEYREGWHPSIHMPRWASRLTLEVTEVRVERLQAITANDCIAEGIPSRGIDRDGPCIASAMIYIDDYRTLWDSLNTKRGFGWDVNPWVWVISFVRSTPLGSEGVDCG